MHRGTFLNVCSVCRRPVLGLPGHDWFVEPFMLTDEALKGDVLPGACHLQCLVELGKNEVWAAAVSNYYESRWPQSDGGVTFGVMWRLHVNPRMKRFYLWRADASIIDFPFGALLSATPDGDSRVIMSLSADLGEVGGEGVDSFMAAMRTDEVGVQVPLGPVLQQLDLSDRYPLVAGPESGWAVRKRSNLGTARRPEWLDVIELHSLVPLDSPIAGAARKMAGAPTRHPR